VASRVTHELEVDGRLVRVSNPDKVLYPSGFTKGQVIDYYIRASSHLLPHLKDRPITLKRYPNGVRAPHFYEKDAPSYTPSWIRTFDVPRRSGEAVIRYVIIDDLPALVWSANLANLEMHPFLHRVPKIDRPTSLVFDLDPGEGANVLDCAKVSFLLKDALERGGLESFVKVSGSKGLQVYVPLNTPLTYAQTQPFARALAEALERLHPDLVVAEMAKARRTRKVFIDWSQNSDFKTTVAVYSLRAKRDQPYCSMPVAWEELRRAARRGNPAALDFDPEAALKRMAKGGDPFEPVLGMKQKLPRAVRASAASRAAAPSQNSSFKPN
jgi:bifunctional non-homologous end joining protein LigD